MVLSTPVWQMGVLSGLGVWTWGEVYHAWFVLPHAHDPALSNCLRMAPNTP